MNIRQAQLPKGWELKKMGEVLSIERGGSPRPIEKYMTNSPDGINWIKISDATASDKYIYETKEKIIKDGLHKTRFVNEGDFILSNSMSFGRPYIMKTTGCIHDGWLVLKQNGKKIFETEFLYYLLSSPFVFQQFNSKAAGSTVRNLNISLVSSVDIPIPPFPEQQRIVAILDEAFAAIAKALANAEQNLLNAKELFKSYLQGVFDPSLRSGQGNKGEDWEGKTLGEVCEELFAGGDVPKGNSSKYETDEFKIPIFSNGEKNKGLYGFTNISRVTKPSITISARGTIGYSEIRHSPFYPAIRLIVVTPKNDIVNLLFLKYVISGIDFKHSGSSIPQLTVPMIKEYPITFPSLKHQQYIVQKLDALIAETKKLEAIYQKKIYDLEELKKSVLQKAFAGELCRTIVGS